MRLQAGWLRYFTDTQTYGIEKMHGIGNVQVQANFLQHIICVPRIFKALLQIDKYQNTVIHSSNCILKRVMSIKFNDYQTIVMLTSCCIKESQVLI